MIKEFKNCNLSIKLDNDQLEDIEAGHTTIFEVLYYELNNKDAYLISEMYCISNYAIGYTFYNIRLDKTYVLTSYDIENVKNGKTIKLYANIPTEEELQDYENMFS